MWYQIKKKPESNINLLLKGKKSFSRYDVTTSCNFTLEMSLNRSINRLSAVSEVKELIF